ncbi:MAG: response regulator transcription factor [Chloroflexi bacterium]|nr:response regulator transcription factor [Chloroflexota bacterium]MDA8186947.1 response regulator transcription factor [Dehalococcoidales bacterium]
MHILIVDDDPMICKVAKFILTDAGYSVSTAATIQAAWSIVQEQDPELVILDVRMPDGSGFEFCERLRQDTYKMPVIFLTGRGEISTKLYGLELGADDYIVKPFEPAELLARVRAVLRRFKASGALAPRTNLKAGNLELNTSELKVTLPGKKTVDLTPTEMKILHCLMENAGHVVSRDSLVDNIWAWDHDGARSEIAVYISRLRKKIEKSPSSPEYIQVVRGIGYRFKAR